MYWTTYSTNVLQCMSKGKTDSGFVDRIILIGLRMLMKGSWMMWRMVMKGLWMCGEDDDGEVVDDDEGW